MVKNTKSYTTTKNVLNKKGVLVEMQTLILALKDAKRTCQDIYLIYIDFTNSFGSIDHAKLLAIMCNLGYPYNVINLVGNTYSLSHTTFIGEYFNKKELIPIQHGTIQGNTLSPYFFIIFLEPLLQCQKKSKYGYSYKTSNSIINTSAYTNDVAIVLGDIKHAPSQIEKFDKFCTWAGMELGVNKCTLIGCPKKSKLNSIKFIAYLQNQNICFRNQEIPIFNQKNHTNISVSILFPHLTGEYKHISPPPNYKNIVNS